LVVDLRKPFAVKHTLAPLAKPKSAPKPAPKKLPPPKQKKPQPLRLPTAAGPPKKAVVVIDAGHGGKDPGAMGSYSVREKTVVLAIAKRLKTLIDATPGMKGVLTRRGDYFIQLRQRLNMARKYNADIFVAVHADAYRHRWATGASIYALSLRGASSEAARWLAEKENTSELGGVKLTNKTQMLREVLLDLSQTATINASLILGNTVLAQLGHITKLHHDSVEQAPFVVLKSPDIPSILVESGFISNPGEARKLSSPHYQQQLARAIFEGIKRYFRQRPPHGTVLAAKRQAGKPTS